MSITRSETPTLITLLAAILLCSCGPVALSKTAYSSPEDVLNISIEAMQNVKSYHFIEESLKRPSSSLWVEGDFSSPTSERISIVDKEDTTRMVRIDTHRYAQFNGETSYEEVPVQLMDGWMPHTRILNDMRGAKQVSIVGDEQAGGTTMLHVTFTFDGTGNENIAAPADITGSTEAYIHVWIEKSTMLIDHYTVSSNKDGAPAYSVAFSKFNQSVSPPIGQPSTIAPSTPTVQY